MTDRQYTPTVSIIIPVYNEELMIKGKIEDALKIEYPRDRLEIVVYDDGSEDNTFQVASRFSNKGITIIKGGINRGLSGAINMALGHASGEIVVKTDADIRVKSNILRKVIPYFADRSVGAVMANQVLVNPRESFATKMEESYQDSLYLVRKAESNVDSVVLGTGAFMAFRRELVQRLNEDENDDVQLPIAIRRKGFRVLFIEKANYYEYAPLHFRDRWKQKVRRGAQVIQILIRNRDLFFNPNYGSYGFKIFPGEFFLYLIAPYTTLLLFILCAFLFVLNPALLLYSFFYSLIVCIVVLFIIGRYTRRKAHDRGNLNIIVTLLTFIYSQLCLLMASLSLIRTKPFKWKKIKSTKRF